MNILICILYETLIRIAVLAVLLITFIITLFSLIIDPILYLIDKIISKFKRKDNNNE